MQILKPISCKIIIVVLIVTIIALYVSQVNANKIFDEPATITIVSRIPPKISYFSYKKTISVVNSSYGYDKQYIQSFNGVSQTSENSTNKSLVSPFYDNITISGIKSGFYKIMTNTSISTKIPQLNKTTTTNAIVTYYIYLVNGTIIYV